MPRLAAWHAAAVPGEHQDIGLVAPVPGAASAEGAHPARLAKGNVTCTAGRACMTYR